MSVPQSPETGQPRKQSRGTAWLRALLVVSLALNLFVIGAVAAHRVWWRGSSVGMGHMRGPSFTQLLPRRFFAEMSDERRQELRALMRGHRGEFRDGRSKLRLAARSVAETLAAEPFEQARFETSLRSFSESGHSLVDMGTEVAREIVSHLTPEERKLLAERLLQRSMGGFRRSDKKKTN